jgi:hypothetical protein
MEASASRGTSFRTATVEATSTADPAYPPQGIVPGRATPSILVTASRDTGGVEAILSIFFRTSFGGRRQTHDRECGETPTR